MILSRKFRTSISSVKGPSPQDGDHWVTKNWQDLSAVSKNKQKTNKQVVSVEILQELHPHAALPHMSDSIWEHLAQNHIMFSKLHTSTHWGTNSSILSKFHGGLRRPLSDLGDHWAFVERPTCNYWEFIERSLGDHRCSLRDQLRSPRDQLRPTEITEWPREFHQKFCVCWNIAERSLKDWWDHWALTESSLSIHWKSASLRDHWKIVLNQFKI